MLRSLMTAVTGVRAHQTMLDVTGNNIANANTMGFKKDFALFSDLMYQTSKSASAPNGNIGGINPAQVGLGVQVSAIETIHTQGGASYTGNQSDMMIQGNGFFVYDNGNGSQLYSRSGATARDADNNLVQSGTGYYIQGYAMEKDPLNPGSYIKASDLSNVNIPLGRKLPAQETTVVQYQCNLDSRSSAYLPYGFADVPYNQDALTDKTPKVFGYSGNRYGTSEVKLGADKDKTFFMSFETNLDSTETLVNNGAASIVLPNTSATPPIPAGYVKDYLSINIGTSNSMDRATTASINFDMVGITKEGNPELKLSTDATGTTSSTSIAPSKIIAASADGKYVLYQYPGTTGTSEKDYFVATYDAGVLTIRDAAASIMDMSGTTPVLRSDIIATGGTPSTFYDATHTGDIGNAKIFQYNVENKMNYGAAKPTVTKIVTSGTIKTLEAQPLSIVAEFDERELWDDKTTLYMWYKIPAGDYDTDGDASIAELTLTEDVMVKMTALVYFNPDGTFSEVGKPTVDPETVGTPALSPLELLGGDDFKIKVGSNGSSLVFTQVVNSTENEIGIIRQGSGIHYTKQKIYDCNGNDYTLEVKFSKITENRWRWDAYILDGNGNAVTELTCDDGSKISVASTDFVPEPNSGEINFCGCGPIVNPESAEIMIPFSLAGMPNANVSLNFGGFGDQLAGVTQYASETTTKAVYQDGYGMGIMEDYSIATDGTITGIYSNGQNIPLYRVALATFANQQGLDKVGDTMFRATVNSGNANIDAAGSNGKGSIMSQNLEMSNVDLTEEFTHLIIAQRGFQANTRVITTSDQILEEVVNLKR